MSDDDDRTGPCNKHHCQCEYCCAGCVGEEAYRRGLNDALEAVVGITSDSTVPIRAEGGRIHRAIRFLISKHGEEP